MGQGKGLADVRGDNDGHSSLAIGWITVDRNHLNTVRRDYADMSDPLAFSAEHGMNKGRNLSGTGGCTRNRTTPERLRALRR